MKPSIHRSFFLVLSFSFFLVACKQNSKQESGELRNLTAEQKKFLYDNAEKIERQPAERQAIINEKGDTVGTVSTQTVIVYLKRAIGGGRFSVGNSCIGTCTGIPLNLCPSGSSSCGCNIVGTNDSCVCGTSCASDGNCTGSCTKGLSIGYGNFGLFIAMEKADKPNTNLASK